MTIYTSTEKRCADKNVIARPDGTWLPEYKEQKTERGREAQWDQNRPLLNCLVDGDERIKTLVRTARREQQARFRNDVCSAHGGRCAASDTDIGDSHRIVLSSNVDMTDYEFLLGGPLRLPEDPTKRPNDELLDMHFKRYLAQQSAA